MKKLTAQEIHDYTRDAIERATFEIECAKKLHHECAYYCIETVRNGDRSLTDSDYRSIAREWNTRLTGKNLDDRDLDFIDQIFQPVTDELHRRGYDMLSVTLGRNDGYGDLEIQVYLDESYLSECTGQKEDTDVLEYNNHDYHADCLDPLFREVATIAEIDPGDRCAACNRTFESETLPC